MALPAAEYQRRYRDRLKAKRELATDPTLPVLTEPLSGYIRADRYRIEAVDWIQQEVGLNLAYLLDGSDKGRELELTENLIASLLISVETLAGLLSEYKQEHVDRAIEAGGRSAEEMTRLVDMRKQLTKRFRKDFAEYDAKGR